MAKELFKVKLRESLTRPRLIAQIQRELFVFVVLISIMPAIPPAPWWIYVTSFITLTGGLEIARRITKYDPFIMNIIFRRLSKQRYYGPTRDASAPMPMHQVSKKKKKRE